jgi:hypothetical protein
MAHDIALHIIRIVEHEKASRSATIECGVPNDPDRNKSSIVFTREDAENVTVTIREKDQPPMKFTIMRKKTLVTATNSRSWKWRRGPF